MRWVRRILTVLIAAVLLPGLALADVKEVRLGVKGAT